MEKMRSGLQEKGAYQATHFCSFYHFCSFFAMILSSRNAIKMNKFLRQNFTYPHIAYKALSAKDFGDLCQRLHNLGKIRDGLVESIDVNGVQLLHGVCHCGLTFHSQRAHIIHNAA